MADEYKGTKSEADLTYDRYDQQRELPPEFELPQDDIKDVGAYTKQSISREPDAEDVEFYVRSDMSSELGGRAPSSSSPSGTAGTESGSYAGTSSAVNELTEDEELPDVPDADDISANSPVDPSAIALTEDMHGTDLINGYDGDDSEEL